MKYIEGWPHHHNIHFDIGMKNPEELDTNYHDIWYNSMLRFRISDRNNDRIGNKMAVGV